MLSKDGYTSPFLNRLVELADRPWGSEELLVFVPGLFTMKRLRILKGQKGGLQYHRLKNEAGVVVQGRLIVRYFDTEIGELTEHILVPGDFFHFPEYSIHQEEAIEDTEIIEVSSPIFNDRVRVEHLFGIDGSGYGLETTTPKEIRRDIRF
jgi:quercetin dioxygenase-like cupin family protein